MYTHMHAFTRAHADTHLPAGVSAYLYFLFRPAVAQDQFIL